MSKADAKVVQKVDVKCVKKCNAELKEYCKENKKKIKSEPFGIDKNKQCKRGKSGNFARLDSKTLRKYISDKIISDDDRSEFCPMTFDDKHCCFIDMDTAFKTQSINIAQAVAEELKDSSHIKYQADRWTAFMENKIQKEYPSNENHSRLRIKVNNMEWIDYFIRIVSFSTILKTAAPSGYKYNDRISYGKMQMIQGASNKSLVFYICKDEHKEIDNKIPAITGVGFWYPQNDHGIRNIIHLYQKHMLNMNFGFLIKPNEVATINQITVELIVKRDSKEQVLTLYDANPNISIAQPHLVPVQNANNDNQSNTYNNNNNNINNNDYQNELYYNQSSQFTIFYDNNNNSNSPNYNYGLTSPDYNDQHVQDWSNGSFLLPPIMPGDNISAITDNGVNQYKPSLSGFFKSSLHRYSPY